MINKKIYKKSNKIKAFKVIEYPNFKVYFQRVNFCDFYYFTLFLNS